MEKFKNVTVKNVDLDKKWHEEVWTYGDLVKVLLASGFPPTKENIDLMLEECKHLFSDSSERFEKIMQIAEGLTLNYGEFSDSCKNCSNEACCRTLLNGNTADWDEGYCRLIEKAWDAFVEAPLAENDSGKKELQDNFTFLIGDGCGCELYFPAGTEREEVWQWFKEHYPKGVDYLLRGNHHTELVYFSCKDLDAKDLNAITRREKVAEETVFLKFRELYKLFNGDLQYGSRIMQTGLVETKSQYPVWELQTERGDSFSFTMGTEFTQVVRDKEKLILRYNGRDRILFLWLSIEEFENATSGDEALIYPECFASKEGPYVICGAVECHQEWCPFHI